LNQIVGIVARAATASQKGVKTADALLDAVHMATRCHEAVGVASACEPVRISMASYVDT
jgi:hypothetical protein